VDDQIIPILACIFDEFHEIYGALIAPASNWTDRAGCAVDSRSTAILGPSGESKMKAILIRFAKDASGATAIEYGLIAAIVAVGIILGLGNLRDGLNTLFNNVVTNLAK
jgi:pilus assembly protein Flp/PilA